MFDKHTEAECMDIFDCWIYIVKNMNMFEQMPFSEKYPVFRKLAEIGDLRKLSREELELYDEDIKNMRDIYAWWASINSHRTSTGENPENEGIRRDYQAALEHIGSRLFFVCLYVMQIYENRIKPSARFQDFYDHIL